MSSKPNIRERMRYWFDNWMSRGPVALMILLGIATLVFVLALGAITSFVLWLIPDGINRIDDGDSVWDIFWGSLMRTLDPGTMGADEGWLFRLLMLVVTVGGLVIVASLIGIVSSAFDGKVEELRKGHSRVLENGHTLILGWNSKVFSIVNEVCIANQSQQKSAVVILADRDKVEMEDEIRTQVGDTGSTRIIVRSGDPMNLAELEVASANTARSIVVLASEGHKNRDATAIKTVLAVTNNPRRKREQYRIVSEIEDPQNLEVARLVGGDETHWVQSSEVISRITVQTCRQSGLSVVISELLDFDGSEIYYSRQPSLVGKTYAEIQQAFATSTVIGFATAGHAHLNPDPGTILLAEADIVLIAEDDSAITLASSPPPDESAITAQRDDTVELERTLVLGSNVGLPQLLRELNEYSARGSTVTVVAETEPPPLKPFSNISVECITADPTRRQVLNELNAHTYDHVIVLASKDTHDPQHADARTLITLLHLRDIAERSGSKLNVVSEMLDDRNRELAEVTKADDFIVSDRLVSLLLSQVSENHHLIEVFDNLFSANGAEIYLRPVEWYVTPGAETSVATVAESARRRGETAIGYKINDLASLSDRRAGVCVNPRKDERLRFTADDKIIVVANS